MKKINLLIVLNANWSSLPQKIEELKKWYAPKVELEIEVQNTKYTDIPFVPYNEDKMGVDRYWFDTRISPRVTAGKTDIVLFTLEVKDWPSHKSVRGWRDNNYPTGAVEISVGVDENEGLWQNGKLIDNMFIKYARHEIMHALYAITGQPDRTHEFGTTDGYARLDDYETLKNCLNELVFVEPKQVDKVIRTSNIIVWLLSFIGILKANPPVWKPEELPPTPPQQQAPKIPYIEKWAEAIKIEEGFFKPGENPKYPNGSLSYRNNNPGNLRFAGQSGAVKTAGNFAKFSTYQQGWDALIRQLRAACEGRSKVYRPDMTLFEFCTVWAPAYDGNDPRRYANNVATRIGVRVDIMIRQLV